MYGVPPVCAWQIIELQTTWRENGPVAFGMSLDTPAVQLARFRAGRLEAPADLESDVLGKNVGVKIIVRTIN